MTRTPTRAIETPYAGFRFRSRTEARWAVGFDAIGCGWNYEPEGYVLPSGTPYLPDFWLPDVGMWAEVKGTTPTTEEIKKAWELCKASGHPVLLLVGAPEMRAYWAVTPHGWPVKLNDGSLVQACDFIIDSAHLDENRFYENTGDGVDSFPAPHSFDASQDLIVSAARAARFEHGEQGAPGVTPGRFACPGSKPEFQPVEVTCESCGIVLNTDFRPEECPGCAELLEWCQSCGKRITEDNAAVEEEGACQACAVYPCMRCGAERPADGVDEEGFSALAMEEVEEAWLDASNRVCGRCMWEDRNP